MRQLHRRPDHAAGRDHPRGDAAGDGRRRSTCRSSRASAARRTRGVQPTRAASTRATWSRSAASGSAGSARSTLEDDHVIVKFEVDDGVEFGKESRASIEVLNLLGEKYLELTPAGEGQLAEDTHDPARAHRVGYDIVGVFGDLTTTTEQIDIDAALAGARRRRRHDGPGRARDRGQLRRASPGSRRPSPPATSRSRRCSRAPRSVTTAARRPQRRHRRPDGERRPGLPGARASRKEAIHRLLVNARILAGELRGLANDNQEQIGPALRRGRRAARACSISKEKELKATLDHLGPYVSHPEQHHRHRPVVRRVRRQPGRRSRPASSCRTAE